jgi:probable phosphoglycerate mutase
MAPSPLVLADLDDPQARSLLLIRHGQTAWNAERRFLGRSDIPLDAVGEAQAAHLAGVLEPVRLDAVWSSPLRRAGATALPLTARRAGLQIHEGLTEMDQGALEGLLGPEAIARFPEFFQAWRADAGAAVVPGGEPFLDCQRRGRASLSEIAATLPPGGQAAVVSHQLLISALLCDLLGEPLAAYSRFSQPNTAINHLGWSPERGLWLIAYGQTGHLSPSPPPSPAPPPPARA